MRQHLTHVPLGKACGWFGITRQAYYQHQISSESRSIIDDLVLSEVTMIRRIHPRIGGRKLYSMLGEFMNAHGIKMGRDALYSLLSSRKLLVQRRKRRVVTTDSRHRFRKYPNLIQGMPVTAPNQVWVSDITYWRVDAWQHVYISFITDAYSRMIVGYHVSETIEAIECAKALQMAISTLKAGIVTMPIHHSDRGTQYCSERYITILTHKNMGISMTQNGDPLENAIAERVNGIIKEEYLDNYTVYSLKEATELLAKAVSLYNFERPHMSLGNMSPHCVHTTEQQQAPKRRWKNYYRPNTSIDDKLCQDNNLHVNPIQDKHHTVNQLQD